MFMDEGGMSPADESGGFRGKGGGGRDPGRQRTERVNTAELDRMAPLPELKNPLPPGTEYFHAEIEWEIELTPVIPESDTNDEEVQG